MISAFAIATESIVLANFNMKSPGRIERERQTDEMDLTYIHHVLLIIQHFKGPDSKGCRRVASDSHPTPSIYVCTSHILQSNNQIQ